MPVGMPNSGGDFISARRSISWYTSSITDAPTIRSLGFILQDELDDWRDGEMMLQSLITEPAELQRAVDHQAKLQQLLLAAGGIAGPGTIGDPYATEQETYA